MQNHLVSLKSGGWRRREFAILFVCAVFLLNNSSSCGRKPVTVTIAVNADGTFTPSAVKIKAGDTIEWVNSLTRSDSIVQIDNPAGFPNSDQCGIADSDLDHPFAASDLNEFTGPTRKGVSGIFVLGQEELGLGQRLSTETCACESLAQPCTPLSVTALDGNSYKLCPDEGLSNQTLDTTWSNPDITGVTLRLYWSEIQIDNNGVIEYDWADLDREMNNAVKNGKLFILDIRAGKNGTPDWIFNDYVGSAAPGPVIRRNFKDWGSDKLPPFNTCGYDFSNGSPPRDDSIGSPTDIAYRDLYVAMINAMATHVASDSRWFQGLAHVKISGANFLSSEARLPKRCYDGNSDQKLDAGCLCNSKIWADAGYTPAKLHEYYRVVGNAIYNAFYQRKSMGYQLIQDGFPKVENASNFEGDTLNDQNGLPLFPAGITADDGNLPGAFSQTKTNLQEGRDGRFVDALGPLNDPVAGKLFIPQHSGIGRLPEDDGNAACSQAAAVDPVTHQAALIATGTQGDGAAGCPNVWAVEEGTLHGQIMGFQTNNATGVGSPADVESALWNLTINSNGVFIELYEERVWEIYQTLGTGAIAAVLDATRATTGKIPSDSKNLITWSKELHQRRQALALLDPTNPHLQDPFPARYKFTFTKPIAAPETYYYINPSKCSQARALGKNPVGQITISK